MNGYNFDSKEDIEKRFFGGFNAPVEFFHNPSSGFRLLSDSLKNTYILEVKFISNYNADSIDSRSFPVSNQFAKLLYKKTGSFIDHFKASGIPPLINGSNLLVVTFRTVVDDEVWSLKIQEPRGDARKMANLCIQILEDAKNNQLDEAKYIKLLEDF